ncbi:hypothetical protein [Sphingobium sp. CR28]|uniref:hypothetical protein n=1 Tax=Sphingobium sp. CR28 TaxID=3400272 RepID=UPI003FEFAB86
MSLLDDPYEAIRANPTEFWSKADGARYIAYCLWTLRHGQIIDPSPIGGDIEGAHTALFWGWLRESSLALELIVKAVLAQIGYRKEVPAKIPSTHNIPQLWKMAGLHRTSEQQEYFLATAHQTLSWAARYPGPLKGAPDLFEPRESLGRRISVSVESTFSRKTRWDTFDELYQIAQSAFIAEQGKSDDSNC